MPLTLVQPDASTLHISVEHHLAGNGITAAQRAVSDCSDTTRIAYLQAALRAMLGWVDHWDRDRDAGLLPTKGSIQAARDGINSSLAFAAAEQPAPLSIAAE